MERNLENSLRHEEALRTLLVVISSEIRTPLTAILGYVDLLLAGQIGILTAQQLECLSHLRKNAQAVQDIYKHHFNAARSAEDIYKHRFDAAKSSVEIYSCLTTVLADTDKLLNGQVGTLTEEQVERVTRLRKTTLNLQHTFEDLFEMYQTMLKET
jgi:signal transduction histidine kinase